MSGPPLRSLWIACGAALAVLAVFACTASAYYLAVGDKGTVIASPDGVSWSPRDAGTAVGMDSIAYGNGVWVAVGISSASTGAIVTSRDTCTWSVQPISVGGLEDVSYGKGVWVAVADGNVVLTSQDNGQTWQKQTLSIPAGGRNTGLYSVAHDGKDEWVAGGDNVYHSTDGKAWTGAPSPALNGFFDLTYGASGWMASGLYEPPLASSDGAAWAPAGPAPTKEGMAGIAFGNGHYVMVGQPSVPAAGGGSAFSSPDGTSWQQVAGGASLEAVAFSGSQWLAVGDGGAILASPAADPTVGPWTPEAAGTKANLMGVASGPAPADPQCSPVCSPSTQTIAEGDTARFSVAGGLPPFAWDAGGGTSTGPWAARQFNASYVGLGTYAAMVKDGLGRSSSCLVQVEPASLECTPATQEALAGQTVTLEAHGGVPPFSWSAPGSSDPGPTAPSAAPYSTSFADAGSWAVTAVDSAGTSAACTVDTHPALSCTASPDPVAPGRNVTFTAAGGAPAFSWSLPDLGQHFVGDRFSTSFGSEGVYRVTVSDEGSPPQTAECSLQVIRPALACAGPTMAEPGATVTWQAVGGTPPHSWSVPGSTQAPVSSETFTASFTERGMHTVTLADAASHSVPCNVDVEDPAPPVRAPLSGMAGLPGAQMPDQAANPPAEPQGNPSVPKATVAVGMDGAGPAGSPTVVIPLRPALRVWADPTSPSVFVFHANRGEGSFGWESGDGSPVATEATPAHAYASPGTYHVQLTFLGSTGQAETASMMVVASGFPAAVASGTPRAEHVATLAWAPLAASLSAVAMVLLRYGWPNFVLAFFSRLRQGELANHPVRSAILDILASRPGLHGPALARLVEKDRKTVSYHLRILCAAGLVVRRRWEGTTGYWLAPADGTAIHAGQAALRLRNAQVLLEAVRRAQGCALPELVVASRLTPKAVRYGLRRLEKAGFVHAVRQGRTLRFFPGESFPPNPNESACSAGAV